MIQNQFNINTYYSIFSINAISVNFSGQYQAALDGKIKCQNQYKHCRLSHGKSMGGPRIGKH